MCATRCCHGDYKNRLLVGWVGHSVQIESPWRDPRQILWLMHGTDAAFYKTNRRPRSVDFQNATPSPSASFLVCTTGPLPNQCSVYGIYPNANLHSIATSPTDQNSLLNASTRLARCFPYVALPKTSLVSRSPALATPIIEATLILLLNCFYTGRLTGFLQIIFVDDVVIIA